MNQQQMEISRSKFGSPVVEMLMQVHQDALWILENMGVGCRHPEIQAVFRQHESTGKAILYENRIYATSELVTDSLEKVPNVNDFFVPKESFFIGGTAPYVYDDKKGQGGISPTPQFVERIARLAQANDVVAGMGRGIKLKDEVEQMNIMAEICEKPLFFAVTSDAALARAVEIHN